MFGRGGNVGRHENAPYMGCVFVSAWREGGEPAGRNVARQENASHLGTHFRDWLEGGGGEPADTTNVPIWARWWCSGGWNVWLEGGMGGGVLREGGGGGVAGEKGVDVSTYIYKYNNKKKEPFVGMGTTAHPHPRHCRALRVGREGEVPPPTCPNGHVGVFGADRMQPNTKTRPCRALRGSQHEKCAVAGTFFVVG